MSRQTNTSDLSSNQTIREAIRKIAWHGMMSKRTGAVKGTGKVTGYVCKIHDGSDLEDDEELLGTIDVQEYIKEASQEDIDNKVGLHEGVLLSAMQNKDMNEAVMIPKLYSEVVVTQDAETGNEFVSMFSQVDIVQFDSHDKVVFGVRERKEFIMDSEEEPDIDELELTGLSSNMTFNKDSIVTTIKNAPNDNVQGVYKEETTISGTSVEIGDGKNVQTKAEVQSEKVHFENGKDNVIETSANGTFIKNGSSVVSIKGNTTYVGSEGSVENAVLGESLVDAFCELLNTLASTTVTTQLGPQPLLTAGQLSSMSGKISAYKAGGGFITNKVKIQK